MRHRLHNLLIVFCMLGVLASSCKRSAPPPPKPTATPTIAIVGGLGHSTPMNELRTMLASDFPAANIVDFGNNNAYLVDVGSYLLLNAHGKIVLIGHSKGGWAVVMAATLLQAHSIPVDLVILYDAVSVGNFSLTIPPNVKRCISFHAGIPTPFIWRATLYGSYEEVVLPWTTHNQVPKDPLAMHDTDDAIKLALGGSP